ncbi:methionine synthase [Bacillus sp. 1P06AnD]|uniref:methionine synthase n=1 Tax=Bacillus sp. 1P06AnD TaxID=3132208 RepID=UPI0039A24D1D
MSKHTIEELMKERILILDGAMGTMIQDANLSPEDFGGEEYDGCNEYLSETAPDIIRNIHEAYLAAGSDIIETNTFGATRIVLDEYQLGHLAYELNVKSARLAKEACLKYASNDKPRFVAGSMGPTTKTLSLTGGTTFTELQDCYQEQAKGLIDGGADVLIIETSQDLLNVKAAFNGIQGAFEQTAVHLPIILSGTIEPMGTTLAGQPIDSFYLSSEFMKPIAVGLNCATGPEFMSDHIRTLSALANTGISCYPNAGLPDEEGHYHESPSSLAEKVKQFASKGWINVVGGCCGTTPAHIAAITEAVADIPPRPIPEKREHHGVSGNDALLYDESMRPLFVGERTNVIGSRKFKDLIRNKQFEEAAEIARAQVKKGAHVIDICLADPDDDEKGNMEDFVREVVKKVKVPLVIDSTDDAVIEQALRHSQGKAIINSVNLEDGEGKFESVSELLHRYGGALVVGTIDEKGMAVTAENKVAVAKRSYDLLVDKFGVHPNDIIFDPLVFPVGTGDEQYIGAANETIKGIKAIKELLPECLTILGISNVSFGLPPRGREILNAVFLYHCTKAGLDYAIVNTEKLERYASIPDEELQLSNELIFQTGDETLQRFIRFYRGKKAQKTTETKQLPLEERLASYIVEGTKEGLIADLDEALGKGLAPLEIINGPLMKGMAQVGELFNDNQLIVAEVLQSAESMKASVSYLEGFMEKGDAGASSKGKIILATVKGDVHDIGKNLVEIILANNGYEIVDLGIKVPPQQIIEAIREHEPSMIGLSGLLVKSAQQMVLTAQDLREQHIETPIMVGGAALSRKFTDTKIAPQYSGSVLYAKDAMEALSLANTMHDNEKKDQFLQELSEKRKKTAAKAGGETASSVAVLEKPVVTVPPAKVMVPASLKRQVLARYSMDHLMPYINKQMLLAHHLGLKGRVDLLLEKRDERAMMLNDLVNGLFQDLIEDKHEVNGVYQFFPAQSDGDNVLIYNPERPGEVLETFHFPRQHKPPFLCLADYLKSVESGEMDYVGFFIVTAGKGIRQKSECLKEQGEFLKSHAIQSLALETAEGFAERIHHIMRDKWGIHDQVEMTMRDRFAAKYTGQRFSFGYPACPNLEDQAKLFRLLKPEDIGIQLTEGFMMEPEASVSAMVFAHPEARYFNVEN